MLHEESNVKIDLDKYIFRLTILVLGGFACFNFWRGTRNAEWIGDLRQVDSNIRETDKRISDQVRKLSDRIDKIENTGPK